MRAHRRSDGGFIRFNLRLVVPVLTFAFAAGFLQAVRAAHDPNFCVTKVTRRTQQCIRLQRRRCIAQSDNVCRRRADLIIQNCDFADIARILHDRDGRVLRRARQGGEHCCFGIVGAAVEGNDDRQFVVWIEQRQKVLHLRSDHARFVVCRHDQPDRRQVRASPRGDLRETAGATASARRASHDSSSGKPAW